MNTQPPAIKIEDFTPLSVEDMNGENLPYHSRFVSDMTADQVGNIAVAPGADSEVDSLFQRAMSFITTRGNVAPNPLGYYHQVPCADSSEPSTSTLTGWSAVLRVLLGSDYVTPRITCLRQLRCLYHLMQAPSVIGISREELDLQTGTTNAPEYVRIIRKKKLHRFGKMVEQKRRKVISNGKSRRRGYYWMTEIGRLVAQDILANAGYVHDAVAAERHARRLEADRRRLIAAFGADQDAKNAVLDGDSSHWVRMVRLLLWKGDWMSRYDIERVIDAPNPPDVVANLNRKFGDEVIETLWSEMLDRDGGLCEIGFYRIAPAWVAKMEAAVRAAAASR